MKKKQLTILFIAMPAHGHMNPCFGIAEQLQERGHRIHFVVHDKQWRGKLISRGFIEETFELPEDDQEVKLGEYMFNEFIANGFIKNATPMEKTNKLLEINWNMQCKPLDPHVKEIIYRIKPDVFLVDVFATPSIIKSNIPWVNLMPPQPLYYLEDERTPPGGSGLPTNDKTGWAEFRNGIQKSVDNYQKDVLAWLAAEGCPPELVVTKNNRFILSPYLNIYAYPKELDYHDVRPTPDNVLQFDSFIRMKDEEFDLPDQLRDKPGKLIYFSMGSMGSADVDLMKRLTSYLSKSSHRFIVSKGALGDSFTLPDNCWGRNSVPQTKVLPMVDLAVVHGGNNTVCEAFYFGTPLIVMPLFTDQFDNAQRVHEKRYGMRMDPYKCGERELLDAIDKLVNDEQLKVKMKRASERIKVSVRSGKLAEAIEDLVEKCS